MSATSEGQVCPYFRRYYDAEPLRDLPNIANQCLALDTATAIDLQYQLNTCMSATGAWSGCSQYVIATAAQRRAAAPVTPMAPAEEDEGFGALEEADALWGAADQTGHKPRSRFDVLPVAGIAGGPGSSRLARTWWWFTSGLSPRFLGCAVLATLVPIVLLILIILFPRLPALLNPAEPTPTSALAFLTYTTTPDATMTEPAGVSSPAPPTSSPSPRPTNTLIVVPTRTRVSITPTPAPSLTATLAVTLTETVVATPTETVAPTPTPIPSPTPTPSLTATRPPTLTPTRTPTQRPAATATQRPAATATQRPAATATQRSAATATRRPAATATRRPSPTATRAPTQVTMRFPAPVLQAPSDGQNFSEGEPIALQWQPVGTLGPNEFYVVTLAYTHSGETWYDEVPWTQSTQWLASGHEYLLDLSDDGRFVWSVYVAQQTGVDASGRPKGTAVSPTSGQRAFSWSASAGGGGDGNTPEPPPP